MSLCGYMALAFVWWVIFLSTASLQLTQAFFCWEEDRYLDYVVRSILLDM